MTSPLTIPVAVDIVALTVIDHTLHALVVRRGIEPFKATGTPRWLPARGRTDGGGRSARTRGGNRRHSAGTPRTALLLRTGRPRPTRTDSLRRLPPPRPLVLAHPGRRRCRGSPVASRRRSPCAHLTPRLRPRENPRGRRGARPLQDRILPPGYLLLRPRVHDHTAAHHLRGHLGISPRPAQLPPKGHQNGLVYRTDGRHRARGRRASGSPLPTRPGVDETASSSTHPCADPPPRPRPRRRRAQARRVRKNKPSTKGEL